MQDFGIFLSFFFNIVDNCFSQVQWRWLSFFSKSCLLSSKSAEICSVRRCNIKEGAAHGGQKWLQGIWLQNFFWVWKPRIQHSCQQELDHFCRYKTIYFIYKALASSCVSNILRGESISSRWMELKSYIVSVKGIQICQILEILVACGSSNLSSLLVSNRMPWAVCMWHSMRLKVSSTISREGVAGRNIEDGGLFSGWEWLHLEIVTLKESRWGVGIDWWILCGLYWYDSQLLSGTKCMLIVLSGQTPAHHGSSTK